jgi:myb proto-oncogene protein
MEEEDVDFLESLLKKTSLPFYDVIAGDESPMMSSYSDLLGRSISRTDSTGTPLDLFPWDGLAPFESFDSPTLPVLGMENNMKFLKLDSRENSADLSAALRCNRQYQNELRMALASVEHALAVNRSQQMRLSAANKKIHVLTNKASRPMVSHTPTIVPTHPFSFESLISAAPEADRQQYEAMQEYRRWVDRPSKWSPKEQQMLRDGVLTACRKVLISRSPGGDAIAVHEQMALIQRMTDLDLLNMALNGVDWEYVSQHHMHAGRTAIDCRIQWHNNQDPRLNNEQWTEAELSRLKDLVEKYTPKGRWNEIAEELETGRVGWQCLAAYQRHLRKDLLKGRWSTEEDAKLLGLVRECSGPDGQVNWPRVTNAIYDRTAAQCIHRYYKALDPSIRRGRWTPEEDEMLRLGVSLHDHDWYLVCRWVPHRTDMQCRERWMNVLHPALKQEKFTPEEDNLLLKTVEEAGGPGSWAAIQSAHFPTRTDNQLRRRYNQLTSGKRNKRRAADEEVAPAERKGPGRPRKKVAESVPVPERVVKRIPANFVRRTSSRHRE